MELVPEAQASAKKLYGTSPHRTNTGKLSAVDGKIRVKTNVRTAIITMGFNSDQNAPRDMFRYRILKSFRTRFRRRNR
jgi:hypothetical protein